MWFLHTWWFLHLRTIGTQDSSLRTFSSVSGSSSSTSYTDAFARLERVVPRTDGQAGPELSLLSRVSCAPEPRVWRRARASRVKPCPLAPCTVK